MFLFNDTRISCQDDKNEIEAYNRILEVLLESDKLPIDCYQLILEAMTISGLSKPKIVECLRDGFIDITLVDGVAHREPRIYFEDDEEEVYEDEDLEADNDNSSASITPAFAASEPATKAVTTEKPPRRLRDMTKVSGIIGQFCSEYTIPEAIEAFMPEHFKYEGNGTYSSPDGTTSQLIPNEDDQYMYPSYSLVTRYDPKAKSINAWDLCRIVLFGDEDVDSMYQQVWRRPSGAKLIALWKEKKRSQR